MWAASPKILVVGDSLSSGYGVANEQNWVSLLQRKLLEHGYSHSVINASVSGDTTAQGLGKLPAVLRRHQPHIVIIELGGNDGLRALPVDMVHQNLAQMIQLSLNNDAKVLLVGTKLPPNYGPVYVSAFESIYTTLAQAYDIVLVPFLLQDVATDGELMQEDGIHPNAAGHRAMLETVWPQLRNLLAANTSLRKIRCMVPPQPLRADPVMRHGNRSWPPRPAAGRCARPA